MGPNSCCHGRFKKKTYTLYALLQHFFFPSFFCTKTIGFLYFFTFFALFLRNSLISVSLLTATVFFFFFRCIPLSCFWNNRQLSSEVTLLREVAPCISRTTLLCIAYGKRTVLFLYSLVSSSTDIGSLFWQTPWHVSVKQHYRFFEFVAECLLFLSCRFAFVTCKQCDLDIKRGARTVPKLKRDWKKSRDVASERSRQFHFRSVVNERFQVSKTSMPYWDLWCHGIPGDTRSRKTRSATYCSYCCSVQLPITEWQNLLWEF